MDNIRETWCFNKDEYERAREIFAQILQGRNCDIDSEYFIDRVSPPSAFLALYSDPDLRIGFLDSNNVVLLITLFSELVEVEDFKFERPEETQGIVPDADEWDDWVKGRIAEILSI